MDKIDVFGIIATAMIMLFFLTWIGYATTENNDGFAAGMLIEVFVLMILFIFVLPLLLGYLTQ